MHSLFALAALAASLPFAAATPPACLLGVIGIQSNPSDVQLLCQGMQDAMLGNLTTSCEGGNLEGAYNAYKDTCEEVGVEVAALPTPSASGSASPSRTGSGSTPTGTDSTEEDEEDASGDENSDASNDETTDEPDSATGYTPSALMALSAAIGVAAVFL